MAACCGQKQCYESEGVNQNIKVVDCENTKLSVDAMLIRAEGNCSQVIILCGLTRDPFNKVVMQFIVNIKILFIGTLKMHNWIKICEVCCLIY